MNMQSYLNKVIKKINRVVFIYLLAIVITLTASYIIESKLAFGNNNYVISSALVSLLGSTIIAWIIFIRPAYLQYFGYENLCKNKEFKELVNNKEIINKLITFDKFKDLTQFNTISIIFRIVNLKMSNMKNLKFNHLPMIFKDYYLINEPILNNIQFEIKHQKVNTYANILAVLFVLSGVLATIYFLMNQ